MQRRGIGMLLIAAALAAPARAQKAPETGYAFPAGGRAGSTVELRLGGYDWTPDTEVFLHDRRVKLEPVGPLGPILVTPPPYWFGPKSYSSPAPQPRELPVRVVLPADLPPGLFRWQVANANGASETGVFQVGSLPEVVEQEGRRAAQTLSELPLTVSGRLGRIEEVDRFRFTARRSGRVQCDAWSRRLGADVHLVLQIRDAQGRLVAETADTEGRDPTLDFAVSQGESYELAVHDLDFRGDWAYVYRLHLTETPAESASAAGGAPVEGGLPGTTQGVLAQGRAAHRFPWTGRKGEIWRLQVASRSLGARWDTSLQVLGPDGKELARNEDLPGTSDSGLEVALPADGIYTAVVSGAAARSVGPGAFRLTVRPAAPDFSLRLPQSLNVPSGGKADLKFAVQRTGGFRGPIRIRFEELPAGFRAPAAITVPEGANQLSVPIELPAATAVTAALVRAVGTATVDDQEVVRAAVVEASGPLTTRTPEERETDRFLIAGTMKPPFR
ncbi:MAG: hypothetical protein FJX77_11830, partial [Armatimonadetes bacterium]|nr:hypothetical protein [Armatimonadota bacterium]